MTNLHDGFLALVKQSITLIPTESLNEVENHTTTPSTIPSIKGNLHKICFGKKRLRASLKHWINSKVGSAKCLSSHTAYLERARADGYWVGAIMDEATAKEEEDEEEVDRTIPNRHKLLNASIMYDFSDVSSIDPETFLDVYHEGTLYLGVIFDEKEPPTFHRMESSPAVLTCAARLYRHLLWRRSYLVQLDPTTSAYGFAVTCGQGLGGDFLAVYKLDMSLTSSSTTTIGSRVPVRVESKHAPISVTDMQSASSLLNDLGNFFLTPRANIAKEAQLHDNHPMLSNSYLYPGPVMLLPDDMRQKFHQQEQATKETNTAHVTPRFKVMPTITGSLVIRCADLETLKEVVSLDRLGNDSSIVTATDAWYVKCKTPLLYGPFWETSKVAINDTRKRLTKLLEQSKKYGLSDRQVQVAGARGYSCWKCVALLQSFSIAETDPGGLGRSARDKPFHRNTQNEKEERQYPAALINFPDLYTKHQLQELFEYYIKKYYVDYAEAWSMFQNERDLPNNKELGFQATVRHRQKVLGAFLSCKSTEA